MEDEKEAELIYRVVCGDESAFNELYSKYSKMLIGFVYKYTRDTDATIDIVQETFIRFLENVKNYSPRGSFKSFIFTTALNIIRDRKRKEKRDRKLLEDISYEVFTKDSRTTIRDDIINIIDSLPDRDKEIIIFRLEGYKIEEIANIEKCSTRTVKRVLKRVINYIRDKLQGG